MERPRHLPNNLVITWGRGDFSIAGILEKPIIEGYPHGVGRQVVEKRDELHQLPEEVIKLLFYKAIGMANADRHKWYQFYRTDKETDVPENDNNRPFIMDTSPRYFPGAETKDIQYEGTIYHSDPSHIKKY